jgi:hypothetical protein
LASSTKKAAGKTLHGRPLYAEANRRYRLNHAHSIPRLYGTNTRKNWRGPVVVLVHDETAALLVVHGPVKSLAWSSKPWLQVITTLLPSRVMLSVGELPIA